MLWIGRLPKAKDEQGEFLDPKGIRHAIALAQKTGSHLKIAGSVEDMAFFDKDVKPHLHDNIEWVGEVSSEQKMQREDIVRLYQKAKVFLMTINWEEPFGMVMAEAMSCGTPVIAFDRGAAKEVVADGESGFVVPPEKGIEGLTEALSKITVYSSQNCRKRVEEHFSIPKMVENYEAYIIRF
jgi:UDP-glucose:tetrahydrobiopterin glucosyltransferase